MDRSGFQRVVPIILVVIVVGLVIAALVSIGRTFFADMGGSSPSPTPQVNVGKQALTQATADRSVRMTVRGPLVADEKFHSYVIMISPDARTMTTYQGYSGQQVDTSQLQNTMVAYDQFVHALDRAKLMDGTPLTGDSNDTRGICATGMLYTFEVLQGENVVQALWASTCAGSLGSLTANQPQITRLFTAQIPDAAKLTSKINL